MRLEYAVNVLKLVVERVELFQQDFARTGTVVLLSWEAILSSQSVDSQILEIQGTQHPVHEEVPICRPTKVISREDIEREFEVFQNWKVVARQLGVSSKTLCRIHLEFGMNISETSIPILTIYQMRICVVNLEILLLFFQKQEKLLLLGICDQDQFMFNEEGFVRL